MSQVTKTRKRGSFDKTWRSSNTKVRFTKYEVAMHQQSKMGPLRISEIVLRTSTSAYSSKAKRRNGASARRQFPLNLIAGRDEPALSLLHRAIQPAYMHCLY